MARVNWRIRCSAPVAQEFDTLVLRNVAHDGWQWDVGQYRAQYVRDEFHRRTQLAMGHASARGMFVHLYTNGLYWGLYNLTERPDDSFAAAYFGINESDWDGLNSGFSHSAVTNDSGDRGVRQPCSRVLARGDEGGKPAAAGEQ